MEVEVGGGFGNGPEKKTYTFFFLLDWSKTAELAGCCSEGRSSAGDKQTASQTPIGM